MKKIFLIISLFLLLKIPCNGFTVQAQPVPANPATSTTSSAPTQPTRNPLSEPQPTLRSKLKIIQYILLPLAVGASIWLILRMEKMEMEKTKGNDGQ
ncbi:MAG: hypothetical protein AYP45_07890 [Candidatus Brocadia carolinensis]|uniref:Uncharacterized protein n=1 Tax=Candidatus Brocadia carolinensis TaxID=1004156 RepID=A0A1V4AU59_9BACT|nr:MAG: hypothetical protein AYP45_07890 [Candidatus Brocadia caroliniensis]